ncbi:MAG: hypothetical protein IKX26_06450 [Bacteroidales bacterium]|nr:hypothetical protein [Bacteroidales bacterium]
MKTLTLYPSAKINLGLYVFEKREDGFHEIESIFFPVSPENSNLVPDKLTVNVCSTQSEETLFYTENYSEKVRMIECGLDYPGYPQDNICVKAYELLDADFQLPPAVIVLEKHIPVGAGLGGGSSDGVCTLTALNELCGLNLTDDQLMEYAAKLGSDCPFFVRNTPMLVTGRGEILTPLSECSSPERASCNMKETALLSSTNEAEKESQISKSLKNLMENYRVEIAFSPDCFVSTKKAYSIVPKRKKVGSGRIIHDSKSGENCQYTKSSTPYTALTELISIPVEMWQGRIVNDFEAPVFKEFPQLQKVKDSLKEIGAAYVSMTGSGSAIYAIFKK